MKIGTQQNLLVRVCAGVSSVVMVLLQILPYASARRHQYITPRRDANVIRNRTTLGRACLMAAVLVVGLSSSLQAVDGVWLITQSGALSGYVTPGDAPGFPVTITQPGSYRLAGNLTVPTVFFTAIEITTDDVTLDLNGFSILVASSRCITAGGMPCPAQGRGIDAENRDNIAVLNGTVRGMGGIGIFLGSNARVDKVSVIDNGNGGIATSQNSVVTGNKAQGNGGIAGIFAGNYSIAQGNVALRNTRDGIHAGSGSTVQGNTSNFNGMDGISVGVASTVIGNTARQNARFGLGLAASTFPNDTIGYANNVVTYNGQAQVSGGTSLGQNLCNGSVC